MNIYIDFDGTLFDSTMQYKKLLKLLKKYNIEKDYIENLKKEKFYQEEKSYDVLAKRIIKEKNIDTSILKEIDKIYTKDLVYPDVIPFLEKYHQKYNLILLTLGNINNQKKKIKASEISNYFKDIIITNKDKSKLNIDYKNGIFIDNNPLEIEKFHKSNAIKLIRIKRDNDKYSKLKLNIDNIPEFINLEELSDKKYIEQIGDK